MPEPTECPKCWGTGWTSHDCQCTECDGLGEVDGDPFYVQADRIYEDLKDRQAEER